jgi:two-component system, OmpR family, sensor histidine kinase KdpD
MTEQRRTPEELLRLVQAEEEAGKQRGKLKVFLGYASGVGKSFRMVDEGRRRKERGEDVIVGAIQPQTSPEVQAALVHQEIAPLRVIDGVPVMDVAAILKRKPRVCLVDGLAYNNPAGSRNPSRWKDVQELLEAGIDVITSINIQYIAELRTRVETLTGKHVESTVPQEFLYSADEIAVVDVPPEMCVTRTPHGEVEESGNPARQLSELREIALLLAADVVDHQLEQYLDRHGLTQSFGTQERILVCVTPRANARAMIESGRRNAQRFHGEWIVAYVQQHGLSAGDQEALERNLSLGRENGAEIQILQGEDPIEAILQYARGRGITQIFIGHTLRHKWWQRLAGSHVDRLIEQAHGIDVRIFPH